MKEIFRFFHKCFFALQKFKSFFILSIFFDALLQGIKLIEPWILASMLDSLYKNSKDVFLQKVATLSLIIIMQITLSYIFIRLKSYVTRGVNAVCKKNIYSKIADVPPTLLSDYSTGNLINVTLDDSAHIVDYCYTLCSYRKSMDAIRKQVKKEYSPCDSCEFNIYCSNSCYIDKLIDYPSCTEYMDKLLEYIFRNIDLLR